MPLIEGLNKVMIIGSGPIVIGQACEFDYSGVQACKALKQLGLEVVLVNSNPATIMTDSETAEKIYVEPLQLDYVKKILEKERPSALISTLGGQTALNLSIELEKTGLLSELGVKLLGADLKVIQSVEDREQFIQLLSKLGAGYAPNRMVRSFKQGLREVEKLGFPVILRPNYTLGGSGGGVAYSMEGFKIKLVEALTESPSSEVLIEKSLLGWKEYELEIMRDKKGTCVVVCSIENVDPCGVHTGDSITVAPQITLSDQAYQEMREEALRIIKEVGLETGGANIQFAVHPKTGERRVIEVNPRVSRSSALASKATGFPIAKISALLAVGFTLDEIKNDITGKTLSCYEPALDYIVTKVPRFDFEKYPGAEDILSTQMQSVGEVMAIGRTFKESFQKALVSLEKQEMNVNFSFDEKKLAYPNSCRIYYIFGAFRRGYTVEALSHLTGIDPWFLEQFEDIVKMETKLVESSKPWSVNLIHQAKRFGFSDKKLSVLLSATEREIYKFRKKTGLYPSFYKVDTCAAEFESQTPYYYSTYWGQGEEDQERKKKKTVLLIGSGPNRIGQGIEFDYSCVRGVRELKRQGYQVALINSNPETVSTDYDTADQLFFEPVSLEHTREVLDFIKPYRVIVQLGGQTPIELAGELHRESFKIAGSSVKTIDLAEDRGRFVRVCSRLGFKTPRSALAENLEKALSASQIVGFPLIVRPSYVLGGRRMEVIQNKKELKHYFAKYAQFFSKARPCLIDQYLESFLEVDVDLVRGQDWAVVGGILEHIEAAGVHSGDSMAVLPPQRLKKAVGEKIEKLSLALAEELKVLGFLNLQLAIREDEIYMLEANPRSSRSVPFISKATGLPLVDLAIKAMMGKKKKDLKQLKSWNSVRNISVKGVVFPFKKIKKTDSILGPEMKSIGEVMGRAEDYPTALTKALVSSDFHFPEKGEIFLSLRDKDKMFLLSHFQDLAKAGYTFSATEGTANFLRKHDIPCIYVKKVLQGRPHCVDRIISGKSVLVFNTTSKHSSIQSSFSIRRNCIDHNIPCLTEAHAIQAFIIALIKRKKSKWTVTTL